MKALWRISVRLFASLFIVFYVLTSTLPMVALAATPKSPLPTCFITVNPSSISVGGSVTVKWQSANATAGAITNIGNVGPNGSINLLPSSAAVTTYYGAFTGPGGTTNCQGSVAVNSSSNGGGATTGNGSTIDPTLTNTPTALGVPTTLPSSQGSSGLVPCGYGKFTGGNEQSSSTGCQACSLVQLIQNIITFAIGIAIPIAAALMAYAGVLYFTSAAKPGNIEKAKGIFKDALVGFLIAITAWLVINTLLHVIFAGSPQFGSGNWFSIQCDTDTNKRPVNNNIAQILSQLPIVAGNTGQIQPDGSSNISTNGTGGSSGTGGVSGGSGGNCPSGFTYDSTSGDSPTCYNPTTDMVQDPIPSGQQCPTGSSYYPADTASGTLGSCYNAQTDTISEPLNVAGASTGGKRGVALCADGNDNCSTSVLQSQGLNGAQAQAMSCIAITELSGQASGCSGTGPCGTFQISQTNWKQYAPAGCSAANFNGNITAAQNNAQCNLQTAAVMVQDQGYQPWTGANNGVYWNPAARSCVANYDPNNLH